jgi:hypothetical protein
MGCEPVGSARAVGQDVAAGVADEGTTLDLAEAKKHQAIISLITLLGSTPVSLASSPWNLIEKASGESPMGSGPTFG